MPVQVTGGSGSDRARSKRAYKHVVEILPSDLTIPIKISSLAVGSTGLEALSNAGGAEISGEVFGRKKLQGYAELVLYEEIAHYIAADAGLPHNTNAGAFLQETFANYVKFRLGRRHQPQLFRRELTMPEIRRDGEWRFYTFGKDFGASLAGTTEADPLIERFLGDAQVAPAIRERGSEVYAELTAAELGPRALLHRCLELYPELETLWRNV